MDEGTTQRGTDTLVHRPEKPAGSTYSSTSGLSPLKNSRGKWGFIPLHKTMPDSPVPTLQGLCDPNQTSASEVTRGTLRFLPPLEIRTSSIARNPVESRETRPSSTVSLTSQRHPASLLSRGYLFSLFGQITCYMWVVLAQRVTKSQKKSGVQVNSTYDEKC